MTKNLVQTSKAAAAVFGKSFQIAVQKKSFLKSMLIEGRLPSSGFLGLRLPLVDSRTSFLLKTERLSSA